jgi:hypothetical protein
MGHVSDARLGAIGEGQPVQRREHAHIDACLICRRVLAVHGATLPPPPRHNPYGRVLLVAGIAVLLIVVAAVAPVRSLALGFVEIFEPRNIAFVPMTAADFAQMHAMPDFSAIGEAHEITQSQHTQAPDARSASAIAGYRLRLPQALSGASESQFEIFRPGIEQLTFSNAKARNWAAAHAVALQPMPVGMDGSVIRVAFGPIVTATYGVHLAPFPMAPPRANENLHRGRYRIEVQRSEHHIAWWGSGRRPTVVVQMPVPRVGSSGVSVQTIEAYLLSQPGVPPRLAAAFAGLRDPSTTLPIPLPINRDYSQPIFVDGVWGLGIGDETGLGAVVVWSRDGFIYGVGGSGTAREILAVANSLN